MAEVKTVTVEFNADTKGLEDAAKKTDAAFDKINDNVKKTGENTKKFTEETRTGVDQVSEGFKGLGIAIGSAAIIAGMNKIISKSLDMAGNFEKTKTAFKSLLGSGIEADKFAASLNKFSKGTILDPQNINEAAKALLAFGIEQNKIEGNLQAIGDISAATGKNFNELAVIFGKAKTQGVLFAEDINQLTEAGIPVIAEFAKILGVETSEVKKLGSQGKISFDILDQAFKNMTSSGGQFFGFMADQTKTYQGQIEKMGVATDNIFRNLGEHWIHIGDNFRDELTDMATAIADWLAIPVSEKMEEEALKVDVLVAQITDLNTTEQERTRLIGELNSVYPAFFENLDKDNITNAQITERYKQVNEQLINRIVLQKEEEKVQEAAADAAEARSEHLETEIELRRKLIEVNKEYGLGVDLNNKTLKQSRNEIVAALGDIGVHLPELARLNAQFMSGQQDVKEATDLSTQALKDKAEVMKLLGITTEDLNKKTEGDTGTGATVTTAAEQKKIEAAKKAAEKAAEAKQKAFEKERDAAFDENQKFQDDELKNFEDETKQQEKQDKEKLDAEQKSFDELEKIADEAFSADEKRLEKKKELDAKELQSSVSKNQALQQTALTTGTQLLSNLAAYYQSEADLSGGSQQAQVDAFNTKQSIAEATVAINAVVAASNYIVAASAAFAVGNIPGGILNTALAAETAISAGIQIATIENQRTVGVKSLQTKKFAKGTDLVLGPGTTTSDSVRADLSKHEAVIQADMNLKHHGFVKAIRRDKVDDYVMKNYLPDMLNKRSDSGMAAAFASLKMMDDGRIVYNLKEQKRVAQEHTELLHKIANNSDSSYFNSRYK